MQAVTSRHAEPEILLEFYDRVRGQTEKLCEPLEIEDYIPQPIVDVSPPKWNIAHTTWFFEEMVLKKYVPGYQVFDPNFAFLFNSYYNTLGDRTARDHRGDLSRPTVRRIFEYRRHVDRAMRELLASMQKPAQMQKPAREQGRYALTDTQEETRPSGSVATGPLSEELQKPAQMQKPAREQGRYALTDTQEETRPSGSVATGPLSEELQKPAQMQKPAALVILGLNHEQQHQELFLTDLKYTFSVNPLFPAYRDNYAPEETAGSGSGQFVEIRSGIYEIGHPGTGFCFDNELARHKVYLDDFAISDRLVTNAEFIEFIDDGGYRDHRLWHSEGWDWLNRDNIASPLYWHHRDGEWHHFTLGGLRLLPPDAPVCHVAFYEAAAFAEWKGMRLPTEFEWEAANAGFDWGLRWEWTNSAYLPYPGFAKAEGAVGEYNGKFMTNQMVLRGASVATPKGHSRPTYRNFFHPHLRWQFTGIRLAR